MTEAFEAINHSIPYEESELYQIRRSAAHIMVQAVLELYPEARMAIGPPTADGFYYDFDLGKDQDGQPVTFRSEDLKNLRKGCARLLAGSIPSSIEK